MLRNLCCVFQVASMFNISAKISLHRLGRSAKVLDDESVFDFRHASHSFIYPFIVSFIV